MICFIQSRGQFVHVKILFFDGSTGGLAQILDDGFDGDVFHTSIRNMPTIYSYTHIYYAIMQLQVIFFSEQSHIVENVNVMKISFQVFLKTLVFF